MQSTEASPAFENVSQRAVFSYLRGLTEFAPVIPGHLSPGERHDMQTSQKELHDFFRAFYQCAYGQPASFGLPLKEDVYIEL